MAQTNVRQGNFLTGEMGAFDASFFSIPSKEAESVDPQSRLLLEASYIALENGSIRLRWAVRI